MSKSPGVQVTEPQHTTEQNTPHLILTKFRDDPPAFLNLLDKCAKWVFDNNIKFVDVGTEVILGSGRHVKYREHLRVRDYLATLKHNL